MQEANKAVELFEKFNCAQAVLAACGPRHGLSEQMCLDLAAACGGGMGRMGDVCGTVSSALAVLGLRHGQDKPADPAQAQAKLNTQVIALTEAFKQRHGSVLCRELTGCTLVTAEGYEQYKKLDLKHTLCRQLVVSAVELLEEK